MVMAMGTGIKLPRNAFDWFVLAGALVNIVIILLLFGYWVTH
jgi:hypothetical protein